MAEPILPQASTSTPKGSTSQIPQTSPSTTQTATIFQLTPNDLQRLVAGVVGATGQSATNGGEKNLKFADQKPFNGKVEDLEALLREAEIHFAIQPTTYDTATKKAYYILSCKGTF